MKSARLFLPATDAIRIMCGHKDSRRHLAQMQGSYREMLEAPQDALAAR